MWLFNVFILEDGPLYCPLIPPDLTIDYTPTVTPPQINSNYCPLTAQDYTIDFNSNPTTVYQTNSNYCPQNNTGFYDFSQPP